MELSSIKTTVDAIVEKLKLENRIKEKVKASVIRALLLLNMKIFMNKNMQGFIERHIRKIGVLNRHFVPNGGEDFLFPPTDLNLRHRKNFGGLSLCFAPIVPQLNYFRSVSQRDFTACSSDNRSEISS